MSKITFRADDDLVEQLEDLEASKSEAMREALRSYLEGDDEAPDGESRAERDLADDLDELVRDRIDERLRQLGIERAGSRARDAAPSPEPQDVNVSISLEGTAVESEDRRRHRPRESAPSDGEPVNARDRPRSHSSDGRTESDDRDGNRQCNQCGDRLDGDHVYCPNCGEKASRRLFCDCGDEVRSDWSFCPGCGRRTPAADVLESDSTQF